MGNPVKINEGNRVDCTHVETETRLMAPKQKPDATDTEPPEEARPDTTGTPLLAEDGKLLSPDVKFTAVNLTTPPQLR